RELERRAGARRRLVEEIEDRPPAQRRDLLDLAVGDLGERGGAVADALDVAAVEVLDRQEMPHATASAWALIVTSSTPSSSARWTLTRSPSEVGRFLPT